jgi:hypothetical protein
MGGYNAMNQNYCHAWSQVTLSPEADERIAQALRPGSTPTVPKPQRKTPKLLAAALAAVLLLSVTALAAYDFDLGEVSRAFRLLWGIEDTSVPSVRRYDTVTEADNARTSDPYYTGQGEIYVSTVQRFLSQHFLTVDLYVSTVTSDQVSDEQFVWRAKLEGSDDYLVAQCLTNTDDISSLPGYITLRLILPQEDIVGDELHLTIYGGYESDDGTAFDIRRAGIVSVTVPPLDESLAVTLDEPISFTNSQTGESATITALEVHTTCLVVYAHIDGIYDIMESYNGDPWSYVWSQSLNQALADGFVTLENGETVVWLSGNMLWLPDDTYVCFCKYDVPPDGLLDISQAVSITLGGQTIAIN